MEHVECISIPLSIFTRSTSFIHSAHNHFMCTCVTRPSLSSSLPRHDSVYPSHSSIREGTGTATTVQSNRHGTKTHQKNSATHTVLLLLFVCFTIHSVDHTTITKGEMVATKKNLKNNSCRESNRFTFSVWLWGKKCKQKAEERRCFVFLSANIYFFITDDRNSSTPFNQPFPDDNTTGYDAPCPSCPPLFLLNPQRLSHHPVTPPHPLPPPSIRRDLASSKGQTAGMDRWFWGGKGKTAAEEEGETRGRGGGGGTKMERYV